MNAIVKLGGGWVQGWCRSLKVNGDVQWMSGLLR